MRVSHLRVQHLRTHKDYSLPIAPDVTLITGPNGSGKTSLIEALHIALIGSSFKGGDDSIIQNTASWYRIDVEFNDKTKRVVKFSTDKQTGRKQFEIDSKISYRLNAKHKIPVVLFEPDDLRLLGGSPARRRRFLDLFISKLDSEYATALRRYERVLKQRNSLLKRSQVSNDDLFAWNVSLSEYGAYIVEKRSVFIKELNESINDTYRSIAKKHDTISLQYSYHQYNDIRQKLLNDLHQHIDKDKLLGYTSTGPHRHDMLVSFNHSPAISVASRGEMRTIILALKFLEVAIIESTTGIKPLILLDDVFSELDESRQKSLITEFKQYQIVIASVNTFPIHGLIIDVSKK